MEQSKIPFDATDMTVLEAYKLSYNVAKSEFETINDPLAQQLKKDRQAAVFIFHEKMKEANQAFAAVEKQLKQKHANAVKSAEELYTRIVNKAYLERDWLIFEAHEQCANGRKKRIWAEVFHECDTKVQAANDTYNSIDQQAGEQKKETIAAADHDLQTALLPFIEMHEMAMEEAHQELDAENERLMQIYLEAAGPAIEKYRAARAERVKSWQAYASVSELCQK